MAILPIYTYDARVLREETKPIEKPGPETAVLALDMLETMKAANGIGLAANQVGQGISMFVVDVSGCEGEEGRPLVFVNPLITGFDGEDVIFEEGCLSVPKVREDIERPERILIKYRDLEFVEQELEADGILARVIQHEYDHLQGIFFTDHLRGLKKRLVMPVLKKIKRGNVDTDYPLAPPAKQSVLA